MKDYFKLGKIGAKAHWKQVNGPIHEHIRKNHKTLKKEKARLVGFIMGDGCISVLGNIPTRQHHDICFYPDHESMVELFIEDFKKLYLKSPHIRNLGKYYAVRVSSKPACDDLRSFGDFSSLKWKAPIFSSKGESIEWLKAMFDCEAHISKKDIRIQSVSKNGIDSVKQLLHSFGIDSKAYTYNRKNPNWNTNHILVISRRENIKRYQNLIGFNHKNKHLKLNLLAGVPERLMGQSRKLVSARTSRFES